ncbi:MAG: hypothetical protein JWM93_2846 [Frankiales bacterium]|nr:hypothetical protein [Frankiales bacterium]
MTIGNQPVACQRGVAAAAVGVSPRVLPRPASHKRTGLALAIVGIIRKHALLYEAVTNHFEGPRSTLLVTRSQQ